MLTMGYVVATNLGVSSLQHRACVLNFPVQAAQVDRHFIHFHRCVGLLHPLHDRQKIPLSVDLFLLSGATAARSPALASATPNLCLSKNLKGITSQASEIKLQTCARRLSIRSTTTSKPSTIMDAAADWHDRRGGKPRRGLRHIGTMQQFLPLRGKGGVGVLLGVALVAATILSHQRYSVRRACFPLHKEVHDGSLTSAIEVVACKNNMAFLFTQPSTGWGGDLEFTSAGSTTCLGVHSSGHFLTVSRSILAAGCAA
jgi:hypothetical protein